MNPDLILASALYNEGAVIMDQARKMGIDVPFVGGNGFNSPQVIKIAGEAADGLIVATPWFGEKDDPKVKTLLKSMKQNMVRNQTNLLHKPMMHFISWLKALKNAGEADRDKLRDALAEIKDFEGILGKFSFDKDGDVVMEPTVLSLKMENSNYLNK